MFGSVHNSFIYINTGQYIFCAYVLSEMFTEINPLWPWCYIWPPPYVSKSKRWWGVANSGCAHCSSPRPDQISYVSTKWRYAAAVIEVAVPHQVDYVVGIAVSYQRIILSLFVHANVYACIIVIDFPFMSLRYVAAYS